MYQPQQQRFIYNKDKPLFSYKGKVREGVNLVSRAINFAEGNLTQGIINVMNKSGVPIYIRVKTFGNGIRDINVKQDAEDPTTIGLALNDNPTLSDQVNAQVKQIIGVSLTPFGWAYEGDKVKDIDVEITQYYKEEEGEDSYPLRYFVMGPFFIDSTWANPQNFYYQTRGYGEVDIPSGSPSRLEFYGTTVDPLTPFDFNNYFLRGTQNVKKEFDYNNFSHMAINSACFLYYPYGTAPTASFNLTELTWEMILLQPGGY